MQCLNRFNKRMSLSGGSLREEGIFNTRELLKDSFADDPSFSTGVYFWRLGLKEYKNEKPIGIRLYSRSFSAANGVTVKFQTLYDTPVMVGDVIYDSKSEEYLICTESFDMNSIHYKGKFTLCNWILKWQNKAGQIFEYPCYDMNATQYNSGEQSNNNFTIASYQHMITLPSDENTIALKSPQRFYLDKNMDNPSSFIVTQNDTTSHNYGKKGLVKLTVYAHPNNPETDRPDLGICDYFELNNDKDICDCNLSRSEIEYDFDIIRKVSRSEIECNTAIIKSGGDSQLFKGKFYDDKGNEIADVIPDWKIICDFSDKLQVEEFDNCLRIGIDDDSCIDEEFKLICSYENDKITVPSSDIIIRIESLL